MRDRVAAARRARGLRGDAAGAPSGGRLSGRLAPSALEPLEARVLMSSVAGRMVFYNHSAFDGDDVNADARDVDAIATDKAALLPGQTAGFANYTSYSRGINGVAIDLAAGAGAAAPGDLGLQDLAFKVGTGADPASWDAGPAPLQVVRLAQSPAPGTSRYLITWADGAIHNEWLQVTVRADAATGLAAADVFYFGNIPGETGNVAGAASVDAQDYAKVRQRSAGGPAGITEPCDFNRDERVNVLDQNIARVAQSRPALVLLAAPELDVTAPTVAVTAPAGGAEVTGVVTVSAEAADDVGVVGVRFLVDGVAVGAEDAAAPYSVDWDTSSVVDGTHHVVAVARDAAGHSTTSELVNVTVYHLDTGAPTVSVTAPGAGATVGGALVSLAADASDNVGVVGVQFLVDGAAVGAEDTSAPYSITWDSRTVQDGSHTVAARARDAAGNVTTSSARPITVANVPTGAAAVGQWGPVMNWPLVAINVSLTKTGQVLMWDGGPDCIGSSSARLWDPATNTFTSVPNPDPFDDNDIFCSGMAMLPDGRLLVAGGHDCTERLLGTPATNIFDPVTRQWTRGPDMHYARWYPTVTALADGRVLVTSGSDVGNNTWIPIPEVYDPVTNAWTELRGASQMIPNYPYMFGLPDGRVLVAGSDEGIIPTRALNLATQTWDMIDPDPVDGGSAVQYAPGKILKAGSSYLADFGTWMSDPSANTAYVLDTTQASPAWRPTGSMANPRTHLDLTVLPDGSVLATGGDRHLGGNDASTAVFPAELWSPVTGTWTTLASMQTPREYHSTALLLPDGRVLVAGGGRNYVNVNAFLSAEIYSPPYLFRGARPTVSSAPETLAYGGSFFVGTPDASNIASVSLVRTGSVTHSIDMDQRYVPLSFTRAAGGLTVQAPADANLAPPGTYMLFIVDANGVPSVAPFTRLPAPYEDSIPPGAPSGLTASGALAAANLSWSPANDNLGVAKYDVYRGTASGFVPTSANLVGSTTGTLFTDAGLAAGTYYYVARAVDAAGNIGPASNEASAVAVGDTAAPSVVLTAPGAGASIAGVVTLSADASDNAAVAGVRFLVDGEAVGVEDVSAPYSIKWSTLSVPNGTHTITAVARDPSGNLATSAPVTVDVQNTSLPGLVAAWGFDEGSGDTVEDLSGQGHDGVISNAEWTTAGRFGGALSFNGEDSWVTVADAPDLHLAVGMTLEAWVRPTTIDGFESVVLKERGHSLSYALYAHDPDRRPFAPSGAINVGSGPDISANGTSQVQLGLWTHLAATYDGAALRIYVNGVLAGSQAAEGEIENTDDALRFGGNVVGEFFSGLIDEIRIYNRALTAHEIAMDSQTPISTGGGASPAAVAAPASAGAVVVPVGTFSEVRMAGRRRTWYEPSPQVF